MEEVKNMPMEEEAVPVFRPDDVDDAHEYLVNAYAALSGLVRDMAEDMEERAVETGEYLPQLCKAACESLRVLAQVGRDLRADEPRGSECGVVILAAADIGEP